MNECNMPVDAKEIPGLHDYFVCRNGKVWSNFKGRPKQLKPSIRNGYASVKIRDGHYLAHRLVMLAYVGHSNLHVDHLDNNRLNNNLENLEYVTPQENTRRKLERAGGAALSFELAKEIRQWRHTHTMEEVAAMYQISFQHVERVWKNEVWPDPDYKSSLTLTNAKAKCLLDEALDVFRKHPELKGELSNAMVSLL